MPEDPVTDRHGERLPAIDLSHVDLTGSEQRPEQHRGGAGRGQHRLGFDPPFERSNSVTLTERQRSAARISAPNNAGGKIARNRTTRRVVGRLHPRLEVRPDILRHLGCQVAHAMRQAALAGGTREAHFDRLDDAGCAIRGHQQRVLKPAQLHALRRRSPSPHTSFDPAIRWSRSASFNQVAPGRQHGSRFCRAAAVRRCRRQTDKRCRSR